MEENNNLHNSLKKKKENVEEIIFLQKTRKAFIPEYACGIFLIFLFFSLYFLNLSVPVMVQKGILVLGLLALIFAEISRKMVTYQITPEKLVIMQGLFKKVQKDIHFNPLSFVPEINIHQGILQRILNYGDIFIESAGVKQLEMKDISNPHQIFSILEDRLEANRIVETKRKFK